MERLTKRITRRFSDVNGQNHLRYLYDLRRIGPLFPKGCKATSAKPLPVRLQSWRGSQPLSVKPKRSFPWARLILLLIVAAGAAYLFVPNLYYLRSDALVKGDLVPVAPLYRVRIDRLYAVCADHVTAGQTLATVSNFMDQANYQRQYLQSVEQVELSKIGLDERVAAAQTNAASLREAYRSAELNARRLGEQFRAYDEAFAQDAVPRVEWQQRRSEWLTAAALANSERLAWRRAEQAIPRLKKDESQRVRSSQDLADASAQLASRTGAEPLTAPVTGYVVDCIQRPQNVIQPGAPMFEIFQPDRAYALAYFSPDAIEHIEIGQKVDVNISGIPKRVTGHVVSVYPELVALPSQLTRFFWQHVQWGQYRPVRIALDGMNAQDREKLYYDAQARVTIELKSSRFEKYTKLKDLARKMTLSDR